MNKKPVGHTYKYFVEVLLDEAEQHGGVLGPKATQATLRPEDYDDLSEEDRQAVDAKLGILDWDGDWRT